MLYVYLMPQIFLRFCSFFIQRYPSQESFVRRTAAFVPSRAENSPLLYTEAHCEYTAGRCFCLRPSFIIASIQDKAALRKDCIRAILLPALKPVAHPSGITNTEEESHCSLIHLFRRLKLRVSYAPFSLEALIDKDSRVFRHRTGN